MWHGLAGQREEPIDVDDLFDGVEEIVVTNRMPLSPRRESKRPRAKSVHRGSCSQRPIDLDDDSDKTRKDTITVVDRRLGGLRMDTNTTSVSGNGQASTGSSRDSRKRQRGHLFRPDAGSGTSTQTANTQFIGLVAPAPSPSAFTDQTMKMDIDEPSLCKVEDDYSSSDDYWDWVRGDCGDADIDEGEDLNDIIDMETALKQSKTLALHEPSSARRKPVKSRILPKAETATLLIGPKPSKGRPSRIWDAYNKFGYPVSPYTPSRADYHQLRPNKGLLSRASSSRSWNVFNSWLNIPSLRLSCPPFKKTSSSVNKIAQSHAFIAVASPTNGGGTDPDMNSGAPEVDQYNREGNLVVWSGQKRMLLDGHSRNWFGESSRGSTKYYTVNDVAFDPLRPNRLVSSGNDRFVRVLDFEICGDTFSPRSVHSFEYTHAPYDIIFKPNSSMFAVSCLDGNIHLHKDDDRFALKVSDGHNSRPGTFIWGASSFNGALHNTLFTSAESEQDGVCRHVTLDVAQQCADYELDINDSGEAMALDPQGRTLALITTTDGNNAHALSLFDVAHGNGKRCAGTHLHSLKPHARRATAKDPLEVTHAVFSPDGILLALSRTDNTTHVYDVRFLTERPWAKLSHTFADHPRVLEHGVTGLRWVEGAQRGRLGLLTGGADGYVRLWDVMRAPTHPDESMILAEVEHDVACFSVGDVSKNEHRLVVGDCAGGVYIYD